MGLMALQITGVSIVYSTVCSGNIKAPRHWPLLGGSTGDRWFPSQRASNAKNVSIWWRHHAMTAQSTGLTLLEIGKFYTLELFSNLNYLSFSDRWCALELCKKHIYRSLSIKKTRSIDIVPYALYNFSIIFINEYRTQSTISLYFRYLDDDECRRSPLGGPRCPPQVQEGPTSSTGGPVPGVS